MRKYDLVISLGTDCCVAHALKRSKITEKTYPLDWSGCDGNADEKLLRKCNLIENHFDGAFDKKDFQHYTDNRVDGAVKNVKTGIHYHHDFLFNVPIDDKFPDFYEKYQRRVKRLYEDVESAKNILFVYQDITMNLSLSGMRKAIEMLKKTFPEKNVNLLVFLPFPKDANVSYQEIKTNIDNLFLFIHPNCGEYWNYVSFLMGKLREFVGVNTYSFAYDKDIISIGFGAIESFGRWSEGDNVFFRLHTTSKEKTVSVSMNVTPFINSKRLTQKCKIMCNGSDVKEIIFDKPGVQEINMVVENNNNGVLDFMFYFDNPVSPKDLGISDDNRKISLGFVDAVIS